MKKERLNFLNQHKRPVSRRDFLSLGLVGFAGLSAFSPRVALSRLMSQKASADLPAFVVMDLAGGAGLPGSFLVGGKGGPGDYLKSYSTLGWNPRQTQNDTRYGLPMAGGGVSQILEGINATLSAEGQQRLRFGSIAHVARDDTSSNPLSALSLVSRAGLSGIFIGKGISSRNSGSGGNSDLVYKNPTLKPMPVNTPEDLQNALGLSKHLSLLSPNAREKLLAQLQKLSTGQTAFLTGNGSQEFSKIVHEAYPKMAKQLDGLNTELDSRNFAASQGAYGINAGSPENSQDVVFSSIVMNVLNGVSGPGALTIGGCDYHDSTQSTGDQKDLEIGQQIGRAFELAHRMQKPLFMQIITDGGVSSRSGSRVWTGESGERGLSVIGYYHPDQPVEYYQGRIQVGNYTEGQTADRTTLVGSSPALAAYSAFANYLNVAGKLGEFDQYAPGIFSRTELESVLVFGG